MEFGYSDWEHIPMTLTEEKDANTLPFYIFTFEGRFTEYNEDEEIFGKLKNEYQRFIIILEEAVSDDIITVLNRRTILEMSKRVLNKITKNYDRIREGVNQIMGCRYLYNGLSIRSCDQTHAN